MVVSMLITQENFISSDTIASYIYNHSDACRDIGHWCGHGAELKISHFCAPFGQFQRATSPQRDVSRLDDEIMAHRSFHCFSPLYPSLPKANSFIAFLSVCSYKAWKIMAPQSNICPHFHSSTQQCACQTVVYSRIHWDTAWHACRFAPDYTHCSALHFHQSFHLSVATTSQLHGSIDRSASGCSWPCRFCKYRYCMVNPWDVTHEEAVKTTLLWWIQSDFYSESSCWSRRHNRQLFTAKYASLMSSFLPSSFWPSRFLLLVTRQLLV